MPDVDHEATIASLHERIAKLRERNSAQFRTIRAQMPVVTMGLALIQAQEQATWDTIRSAFPSHKHWAANLAAHGWVVTVENGTLYALGSTCAYAVGSDAAPSVKVAAAPKRCVNCRFARYHTSEKTAGFRQKRCTVNPESLYVLDVHVCAQHALPDHYSV